MLVSSLRLLTLRPKLDLFLLPGELRGHEGDENCSLWYFSLRGLSPLTTGSANDTLLLCGEQIRICFEI